MSRYSMSVGKVQMFKRVLLCTAMILMVMCASLPYAEAVYATSEPWFLLSTTDTANNQCRDVAESKRSRTLNLHNTCENEIKVELYYENENNYHQTITVKQKSCFAEVSSNENRVYKYCGMDVKTCITRESLCQEEN